MSRPAFDLVERVEDVLAKHARRHVGVAVGVRAEQETQVVGRGRIADDPASSPGADTIFEIGSITKVFTATLLADMAQEGLVTLDDPVQRYLPDGVELRVRGQPITLADLAVHTSGLPRLPKGLFWRAIKERRNPYASFGVDDLHRAVSSARPRRAPGTRVKYSNFGPGLLGHVLALRAGKTYEDLVVERICGPLGMTDTSVSVPASNLGRFARGHNRRGRPVPPWDVPALGGAGALRSTVADMLRFLDLQLGDGPARLAQAASMTQALRARSRTLSVGLGWLTHPLRDRPVQVHWHSGGTGGFRSVAGFVRERRTAVVVLSNSARSVDSIGLRILEALLD